LEYECTPYYGLDAACNNVEQLCENFKNKADFVEVVRCNDCVYSNEDGTICHYGVGRGVKPEHFCGYGERREEE
jgi:hypothetical protein